MNDTACSLKGTYQVFLLNQSKATSCCRATPVSIDRTTLAELTDTWRHEARLLAQGNQLPGCHVCWDKENQGILSYRQQRLAEQDTQIEINLSNLCNHMCAYCSPKFSSVWQHSIQQHGEFVNISKTAKNNQAIIDQNTNYQKL